MNTSPLYYKCVWINQRMPPDSDTLPSFHGYTLQPSNAWSVPPSVTTTKCSNRLLFYHNLLHAAQWPSMKTDRPPHILDHSECHVARNRTIHSKERALTHTYHCMSNSTLTGGTYQCPWSYYSLLGIFRPLKLWKPSIGTNASPRLSSDIIPR
jgi:hypothetical protein